MARPLRIEYPGAVYHVTGRGNERKAIYRDDDDRLGFLDILADVNDRYHWLCHAYCLMGNHYHLLVETPEGNLSQGMRHVNSVYTQRYNKRYGRSGHLFQGRYKSILIQKDSHLLEVCRYVVLNPVRAGMARDPGSWAWDSYRATAGLETPHRCLTVKWVREQFGSVQSAAATAYRHFVQEGIERDSDGMWRDVKAQSILGEDDFVDGLTAYARGKHGDADIVRSQRFLGRPALETLFPKEILKDKQKRNKAIAEAIEGHGYLQREIADHLGMHFSSVSRIMRTAEKMSKK